jgi:two-component system nitrogen regulation sensor histidine kinase GlnL
MTTTAVLLVELRPIAQQLRMEREERRMDQLAATRELVRNLAHEIKNPLGGLRGSAQLLERELQRSELIEYTQGNHQGSRSPAGAPRSAADASASLAAGATQHPRGLRARAHAGHRRIRAWGVDPVQLRPERSRLDGDREQLIQALLNISRNAAQALTSEANRPWHRGTIIFRTRVARQVTVLRQRYRLALELQVIDDGPGVPEEIRDRIFSPLVSGREGGTGLGLSLAQTLISNHQGVIECASRPGRTVFTILLPLA